MQTEKLIESESRVVEAGRKQQECNEAFEVKINELDKMRVALNETKKMLEASEVATQSLVSKEQQLSQKVQSCNEDISKLKGQLQAQSQAKSALESQLTEAKSQCKSLEDRCKRLEDDKTSLVGKCTNAEKELKDTKEVLNALKSDNVSTKKALQGIYFPIFLLSFTLIKLCAVVYRGIKSPNVHHKNTLIWHMIFRCGRVVTDFLPYPKFRKSLLS